ncbi:N,N-dimethylformamidase beta subunit family domain-containing protein [Streptomyces lydicus]|uniref:N,N-dimethylformamidase beta subunit family domain-containing protein n=1 Tax=Streptomyces lydicus TaxID=47763 RepID=UPI001F50B444|nr:N,N-dimethylformamidase beta subunit family domain-containing protein [Streptomyces lydicus]
MGDEPQHGEQRHGGGQRRHGEQPQHSEQRQGGAECGEAGGLGRGASGTSGGTNGTCGPGGPGGLPRRRFLGAAAVGAAGLAVGVTAGCHSTSGAGPGAGPTAGDEPDLAAERDRPGHPDWRIRSAGPPDAVQGYTDKVSVLPGEEFGLYVSTTAPGFRVAAYRVGWYRGAQARRVWYSDRVAGGRQRHPRLLPGTRSVRADWERSLRVRTDGWPPGAYLLRLDAEHGHQRYVPMVVRSARTAGRTVLMHAVATWQAYNAWGGYSLYRGADAGYGSRSLAVSFDRPYDSNGAEKFLVYERALVVLAERLGLPLAYTTGLDVHRDPSALRGATAALSLGHDEYWTPQQREHVTRARDAGTNLAFLGANACFRRIRLEPWRGLEPEPGSESGPGRGSESGPGQGPASDSGQERGPGADSSGVLRTVVCYKTSYRNDPRFAGPHRALPTHDFRQPPAADPESALTGVFYEGYPTDAPYVVHNADHWLFAGTGAKRGDSFDHLVGVEYDRVTPQAPTPERLEILAHSPLVCNGRSSHADSAYYTVPSGAGVFASGTMRWVEALMAGTHDDGRDHGMDDRTRAFVTRTTENLLRAFAVAPAAKIRPAPRNNVAAVYGV